MFQPSSSAETEASSEGKLEWDFTTKELTDLDQDFNSSALTNGTYQAGKVSGQWIKANENMLTVKEDTSTALILKNSYENFQMAVDMDKGVHLPYAVHFGQQSDEIFEENGFYSVLVGQNDGTLYLRGVKQDTAACESGLALTKGAGEVTVSGQFDENYDPVKALTLNLTVKDGVLTVWYTGLEENKVSVELDGYTGGYVALRAQSNDRGGYRRLAMEQIEENTSTWDFTTKELTDLEQDFNSSALTNGTYQAGKVSEQWIKANNNTLTVKEDTSTALILKNSYENFQMAVDMDKGVHLPYAVHFGQQSDEIFEENGFYSVLVGQNDGTLYLRGVKQDTAACESGLALTKGAGEVTVSGQFDENYDPVKALTLNLTVKDGVLTVWYTGLEENKVSVELDGYTGGYVALRAQSNDRGGYRRLAMEQIEENTSTWDFTTKELTDLEQDFNSSALTNGTYQAGKVSEQWIKANNNTLTVKEDTSTALILKNSYENFQMAVDMDKGVHLPYAVHFGQQSDEIFEENGFYSVLVGQNDGTLYLRGVKQDTAACESGLALTKGAGEVTVSGQFDENYDPVKALTLNLTVKDGVLTVWYTGLEQNKVSVELDGYTGGYVALRAQSNDRGGYKSLKLNDLGSSQSDDETVETWNFSGIADLSALESDFDSVCLKSGDAGYVKGTVSDQWQKIDAKLAPKESKATALILKKTFGDFQAEVKINKGLHIPYRIHFGQQSSEDFKENDFYSVMISQNNGELILKGVVEESATCEGGLTLTKQQGQVTVSGQFSEDYDPGKELNLNVKVQDNELTVWYTGYENNKVTVKLAGYAGGYVALYTPSRDRGGFRVLKMKDLGACANPGITPQPDEDPNIVADWEKDFDAYYLNNGKETAAMEKVDMDANWYFDNNGYAKRWKELAGNEYQDVDVLTYKKRQFEDFQVSFYVQQTFNRMGIIIGGTEGQYPVVGDSDGEKLKANGGVLLFVEAEGNSNAMGDFTNGYNIVREVRRRIEPLDASGFVDQNGNAGANVDKRKEHKITLVVKNKELYMFVDDSDQCSMYLSLPDNYKGGYVSLFSACNRTFAIGKFEISDRITKKIPAKGGLVSTEGSTTKIRFNDYPDTSQFSAWYLEELDQTGKLEEVDFYDYWMMADGKLCRKTSMMRANEDKDVAVLTYTGKKYTDFIATFEYQQTWGRLMFLFGTENGSYPLYAKDGKKENGGVLLYPECDLGAGSGVCAWGNVKLSISSYDPLYREISYAPGYYKNGQIGTRYTMTVAVYNKQCNVYIEGFGLVASFELSDDYNGGYISLASSQTDQQGFMSLNITELNGSQPNAVKSVDQIRDITVLQGTALEELALPGTVSVMTVGGSREDVPVQWTKQDYDGTKIGEYKFIGNLSDANGVCNPGMLTAEITVRVRETLPASSVTKTWTFDTKSDLMDFRSFYVKDAKTGKAVEVDTPAWYVSEGKVRKDGFRSKMGSESTELSILTYTGSKYKNFELEVDFTQQYVREMVLFGSKTLGQYIDYSNPKSEDTPVCVYAEYEGRRAAIGNVVNTNYFRRLESDVSSAQENFAENNSYYNKQKGGADLNKMHHMKLRVVGKTATVWIDDQQTSFTATLNDSYTGGYISLVSTAKEGCFDNLSITALNEKGEPMAANQEIAADGTLNIDYQKLEKEEKVEKPIEKPQEITIQEEKTNPIVLYIIILAVVVLAGVTVGMIIIKKKNKKGSN